MLKCFVAMPIKAANSADHAHFRAVYHQCIRPAAEALGYETKRADDVAASGAIGQNIVLSLATADLVIVDLTDLNPNVFYELGVRHVLRGKGTILLLDKKRTEIVPFDLKDYRVIEYNGDLQGISHLSERLRQFIAASREVDDEDRDNPVHHWLPSLPVDVLATSRGDHQRQQEERISKLATRLQWYEKTYGSGPESGSAALPIEIVKKALLDAEAGLLPDDIVARAREAYQERNSKEFLKVVGEIVDKGVKLSDRHCFDLLSWATTFGLDKVAEAIADHAIKHDGGSTSLRQARLGMLAHSRDVNVRVRARNELLTEAGISRNGQAYVVPDSFRPRDIAIATLLLDTFQIAGPHEEELAIAMALLDRYPTDALLLVNCARALGNLRRPVDAYDYYRKALWCGDADETAATWMGNDAHNDSRNADALEAYSLACMFDPDEPTSFAHVAEELSVLLDVKKRSQRTSSLSAKRRGVPNGLDRAVFVEAIRAAISCPGLSTEDLGRIQRSCQRLGDDIESFKETTPNSTDDRLRLAERIYEQMESEFTRGTQVPPAITS
jgi:hypothetical protein